MALAIEHFVQSSPGDINLIDQILVVGIAVALFLLWADVVWLLPSGQSGKHMTRSGQRTRLEQNELRWPFASML